MSERCSELSSYYSNRFEYVINEIVARVDKSAQTESVDGADHLQITGCQFSRTPCILSYITDLYVVMQAYMCDKDE